MARFTAKQTSDSCKSAAGFAMSHRIALIQSIASAMLILVVHLRLLRLKQINTLSPMFG